MAEPQSQPQRPASVPFAAATTGLVLAGGRGTRMGGVDKGLQRHQGLPLVAHALQRLRPQVGTLALSANRHLDTYAAHGVPVWPDELPDHPGPLAGWLTALRRATTPWVASVPCDTPGFPADLVARLAEAVQRTGAPLAIAATPQREHPVFALLHRSLAGPLAEALDRGERRVLRWAQAQGAATAVFEDETAFRNLNTLDDLG